mgnify:CR=1 FL=1
MVVPPPVGSFQNGVECSVHVLLGVVGLEDDSSAEVRAPVPASATAEGSGDIVDPAVVVNVERFSLGALRLEVVEGGEPDDPSRVAVRVGGASVDLYVSVRVCGFHGWSFRVVG